MKSMLKYLKSGTEGYIIQDMPTVGIFLYFCPQSISLGGNHCITLFVGEYYQGYSGQYLNPPTEEIVFSTYLYLAPSPFPSPFLPCSLLLVYLTAIS